MKIIAWLLIRIGNIFYRLNGGLDGIGKEDNIRSRLMYWAWGEAYGISDKLLSKEIANKG